MSDAEGKRENPRTLGWWIVAILTPIGIFGGPIALADLFAGVIDWRGPIPYLLAYWDEHVSAPFETILSFVASFVSLPRPPEIATDYLTLSILLAGSLIRSRGLLERGGENTLDGLIQAAYGRSAEEFGPYRHRLAAGAGLDRIDDPAQRILELRQMIFGGLFWPIALVVEAVNWLSTIWRIGRVEAQIAKYPRLAWENRPGPIEDWKFFRALLRHDAAQQILGLAPFLLFLLIWGANLLWTPQHP